ncbi:TraR/DksA C4-type zinc finger protein [Microbacterium sp. CFH 31415]|uniref:TraR/DksA family transcriptional regulator n=1 Tax=Microbacterium sp. CFH 31415 TaxID=2921732 RepID=UPI001F130FE9|nr:TraR/DksA family transcriptional regulator [Microbacterium sp. CFH 31415]MCH6231152.1 TraR/DksA C4-type zinc finger protein [Microbacterium sp. CFH 31415]
MLADNAAPTLAEPQLDLDEIRRALDTELQRREVIVEELAPRAIPNVDPVAYMTAAATRREIDQIRSALGRLEAGTFGSCTRCGGAIAAGRLEVLPHAETCIDCQSHVES